MSTQIPAFSAGPADVALYTSRASELGGVLGNEPLLSFRCCRARQVQPRGDDRDAVAVIADDS